MYNCKGVNLKDQIVPIKINALYNFIKQGETQASEEFARAAFSVMKTRMEILFPEYFRVQT